MLTVAPLSMDAVLAALKAAGEETRFRILHLLADSELTVKDLTTILGQSQPRISRHLRLLAEAGLVGRYPEGARVYYRLADEAAARRLVHGLTEAADGADPTIGRDRERLKAVKEEHAGAASRYFATNAGDWDVIRSLHVPEQAVESAMREAIGTRLFPSFLDLGTGTGRLLEVFAPLYQRGVGIDSSTAMLGIARTNLGRAGIAHAQVRQGDIYNLSLPRDSFDVVAIHQVLHYLDDPARAVAEAARVMRPGGRLLVVDFAPHGLEFLRERHAHRRLGFDRDAVTGWLADAGLRPELVRDLHPEGGEGDKLTVTLWLGRDPRILMAAADSLSQGDRGVRAVASERQSRLPAAPARLRVSFEFFPPKTEAMEETLWRSIQRLAPLAPSFVSVTYGAGGSTRDRTHHTVNRILRETSLLPAAHLTCVAADRAEVDDVVEGYWGIGVRHIVALRGDPPAGPGTRFDTHPGGYQTSIELIEGIRKIAPFEVSVAAYPEKHPESPSVAVDIDMLKRKVDAGATRAITQFFFDNDTFERYVEKVRAAGIDVPITPGIIPVHNFKQVARFAERCGASVPAWLAARFEGLEEDADTRQLVAAAVAAEQVLDLIDRGVTELHFITMNRADLVYAICHLIGLRPTAAAKKAEPVA